VAHASAGTSAGSPYQHAHAGSLYQRTRCVACVCRVRVQDVSKPMTRVAPLPCYKRVLNKVGVAADAVHWHDKVKRAPARDRTEVAQVSLPRAAPCRCGNASRHAPVSFARLCTTPSNSAVPLQTLSAHTAATACGGVVSAVALDAPRAECTDSV
jgi:hypothetical protein